MALEPSKHVNGRMWPPGVSGNPNGKPVGSRTVFSQGFLKDLASVWAERGRAARSGNQTYSPDCPPSAATQPISKIVRCSVEAAVGHF